MGSGAPRGYDLLKEFIVALLVVSLLTVGLAVVFSSPDDQPVTIARWAGADPTGFLTRGRQRARRLQRHRRVRTALHQHPGRRAEDRADLPAMPARGPHPDRHRQAVRRRPARRAGAS